MSGPFFERFMHLAQVFSCSAEITSAAVDNVNERRYSVSNATDPGA
jgi:hypothetical protein